MDALEWFEMTYITKVQRVVTRIIGLSRGLDPLLEAMPAWMGSRVNVGYAVRCIYKKVKPLSGQPIFLQALPKSGGSWLSYVLSDVTGNIKVGKDFLDFRPISSDGTGWGAMDEFFRDVRLQESAGLQKYKCTTSLLHTHFLPKPDLFEEIGKSGFKLIYLSRDMVEVMLSLYHHILVRECDMSQQLRGMETSKGIDFILDEFLEPFCRYDTLWKNFLSKNEGSYLLEYNKICEDLESEMSKCLGELGLVADARWIEWVSSVYKKPDTIPKEDMHSGLKTRSKNSEVALSHEQKKRVRDEYSSATTTSSRQSGVNNE